MELLKDLYNVFFENGISTSYLILESSHAVRVKNYQVEMIARNKVENILPLDIRFTDQGTSLYYNITSRLQLSQLLKRRKISMDELINILWSIGKTLIDSKEYLLSEKGFILNEDYIFISPASLQASLVYLPVDIEVDILQDFKDFILRLILNIADIEESASDNYLHRILMSVKSETFNIKNFINMLEQMTGIESTSCTGNESVPEIYQDTAAQEDVCGLSDGNGYEDSKGKNGNGKEKKDRNEKRNVRVVVLMGVIALQVALIILIFLNKFIVMPSEDNSLITYLGIVLIIGAMNFILLRPLHKSYTEGKKTAVKDKDNDNDSLQASGSEILVNTVSQGPECLQNSSKGEGYWNKQDSSDIQIGLEKQRVLDTMKDKQNYNDTVLLFPNENRPFLKGAGKDNNELVLISKADFLIGRLKGYVDHVIDNEAVGKIHAQIICVENQYYIKDLNSVNGTYINNVRIESNKEFKVLNGDKITLANEDYIFVNPTLS